MLVSGLTVLVFLSNARFVTREGRTILNFRLPTFAMGPWQASSPSTVNDRPPTPSPVSTRTPTPAPAALPQSRLSEFQMPADEEQTIDLKLGPRERLNGDERHNFAVRQPARGEEGDNSDPLLTPTRCQPVYSSRMRYFKPNAMIQGKYTSVSLPTFVRHFPIQSVSIQVRA